MTKKIYWLPFLALLACQPKPTALQIDPTFTEPENAYTFYVLGDWGRKGDFGQQELADAMNLAGSVVEPEIIISTGDNFYPNGVASTTDYQWIASYEEVYDGYFLNCPWYVVLGNHDYRGNAQAQIDYSSISQRWTMPARYFHKDVIEDDFSIRFLFIDSNPFEHEYYQEEKYKDKVALQDTVRQLLWADSLLSDTSFTYKIVVGHHPMYTGGKRAEEFNSIRYHWERRLKEKGVVLYLAGHEHDLQHIKPEGSVHHVISGAGSEVRPTGNLPESLFSISTQGFLSVSATKDQLLLYFVSKEEKVLYTVTIP